MGRKLGTAPDVAHHGGGPIRGQVSGEEVCILELGTIHGLGAQHRDTLDEQKDICGRWRNRSCSNIMTDSMGQDQGYDQGGRGSTVYTIKASGLWDGFSSYGVLWTESRNAWSLYI